MALPDVTSATVLLKLRLIIYSILVFFSFFIFVSIGVMMERFYGLCPLCANHVRAWVAYSSSRCNYPMVIAIVFQLLYLLFRLVILVTFFLGKLTPEMFLVSDRMEFVYALIDAFATLLTFIGACILSAGTSSVCSPFHNCDIFPWLAPAKVAQAGAWLSTFIWLFVAVWGLLFVWKTGKVPCLTKNDNSNREDSSIKH